MRKWPVTALALGCLAAAVPAKAAVIVDFASRAGDTDASLTGGSARADIKAAFQRIGARYIGQDSVLRITILDINLAGQTEFHRTQAVRVLRGATPPRIAVRYVLRQNRKIAASGEETISDPMYQSRIDIAASSDPLRYEKAMVDDWFRMRFGRGGRNTP